MKPEPHPPAAGSHDADERPRAPVSRRRTRYAAGDVLADKYRLVDLLGEGGMGTVWRAESLVLGIDVALKVVRSDFACPETYQRLVREARVAASIGHPSIVRVFDVGFTEAEEPFLVMELLGGESLGATLLRSPRIPAAKAVELLLPIASALAAAHAKGIIHRDIKPDNILLAPGEDDAVFPKLVDFGIVKVEETVDGKVVTQEGALVGSPQYMSPEQAQGLPVGAQTDVWAFSVVLYEMITGKLPFGGSHPGAILLSVLRDTAVPAPELAAGDADLWAILEKGLDKDTARRYAGMKEIGQALAAWAVARGIETDAAGGSIARQWLRTPSSPSDTVPRSGDASLSSPHLLTPTPTGAAITLQRRARFSPLRLESLRSRATYAAAAVAMTAVAGLVAVTRPAPSAAPSSLVSASMPLARAPLPLPAAPAEPPLPEPAATNAPSALPSAKARVASSPRSSAAAPMKRKPSLPISQNPNF